MCRVAVLPCSFWNAVDPSISGIITSRRMASGCSAAARARPSLPEWAVETCHSATASKQSLATSRMSSSSSITKMRFLFIFIVCSGGLRPAIRRSEGVVTARSPILRCRIPAETPTSNPSYSVLAFMKSIPRHQPSTPQRSARGGTAATLSPPRRFFSIVPTSGLCIPAPSQASRADRPLPPSHLLAESAIGA